MQLDSFVVASLGHELNAALVGARVDKIHMPAPDAVVLGVYTFKGPRRLILSAGKTPRVHFTESRPENPGEPPLMCMLLRKHLQGGRITALRQLGGDRILSLCVASTDELGETGERQLICEMTGRRSNLLLVGPDRTILSCLRKITPESWPERPVLPGLSYRLPPLPDKPALEGLDREAFLALMAACPAGTAPAEHLVRSVGGLSPQLAREVAHLSGFDPGRMFDRLGELLDRLREGTLPAYTVEEEGRIVGVSCLPLTHLAGAESRAHPDFSAALDYACAFDEQEGGQRNLAEGLLKKMDSVKKRIERRLENQREELEQAAAREEIKKQADLIIANLHQLTSGQARATVVDYYDPELREVELRLDPDLSLKDNAGRLYARYGRMKRAEEALRERIRLGEEELRYVNSVIYSLGLAEKAAEVQQIAFELTENGYLKRKPGEKKRKAPPAQPRKSLSPNGFTVLCGRNNRENDQLREGAQGGDLWFHAKDIPGSHVVLRREGGEPGPEDIEYAASVAAFYSAGRTLGKVAVDYTECKYVKKIPNANLGMVNYQRQRTILSAPKPEKTAE